jgi:hypothetical protein
VISTVPLRAALLACSLASAAASAAEPPPIAVLGLRPTVDAAFGATAIAQLAEAQRLRLVVENVVEASSATRVLGHEPLRASLGRAYLVELFDCRGDAGCLLAAARPLRSIGITTALSGDCFMAEAVITVRLRRLDLVREQVADELVFEVPRGDAGALAPWRAGLAPLFGETGSIRLVVSQPESQCLLDGRACPLNAEGTMPEVPEGEHLLVITRDGFKRAERVVQVRRREQARVAVALEELPVQAQKAPDPSARLPTFEQPTDQLQARPFGSFRLAVSLDDLNAGEREDPFIPAETRSGSGTLVVLPRPVVLGVAIQAPRPQSGWQTRGAISLAWVKDAGPEIDSAFAEVINPERGLRIMLGWGSSIVSSLTAGTLTLPEAFGDLNFGGVGVTGSTSFGPILAEAFLGKQKSQFSAGPAVGEAAPLLAGALHLAYVDQAQVGTLYGDEYPFTVGLSALAGQDRVGVGDEAAWVQAIGAPSVPGQVAFWVVSLELYLPFGKTGSLAGEAWAGDDVRLLEGAAWQPPRLDPLTGRHRALRSVGGWAQLAYSPREEVELRLVAGTDQAVGNLGWGRPVGDVPAIRGNSLLALVAVTKWGLLSFGAQVHLVRTTYGDPTRPAALTKALTCTSQLKF